MKRLSDKVGYIALILLSTLVLDVGRYGAWRGFWKKSLGFVDQNAWAYRLIKS